MIKILIVLSTTILLSACTTPGGLAFTMAFKACEAQHLPSELKGLEGDAVDLLLNGASDDQLKTVGIKEGISLGSATLDCVISAAVAGLQAQAMTAAATHASIDPRVLQGAVRGAVFLAKRKR